MTDIERRHQAILSRSASAGHVGLQALARQFRGGPQTVRSDLRDLAQGRLVNSTRGGARRVLFCDQTKSDRAPPLRFCDAAMRGATAMLVAGAADV
ncbi:DeoR family transcriptional regulator [Sedimentitalea sp. HM32M-2]|uniref:DeoR family transcriptional regulator n=1 Tax=Sedimentitalea sp. HM32M-2 TaxID=3351566 RepID=UPI0036446BEC